LGAGWRGRIGRGLRGEGRGPSVADALGRALVCALDDDLAGAEGPLHALVARDSSQVTAYLALGRLFRRRGDVGRALRVHQNLLLRSDLSADDRHLALRGLAADLARGGYAERAADAYDELLARRPRDAVALRARIALYRAGGAPERALGLVATLERLPEDERGADPGPSEASLWHEAAELALREGRHRDARRAARRALRLDDASAATWTLFGELEAERGRSKRALAAWRSALERSETSSAALLARLRSAFAAVGRAAEFPGFLRERLRARPDDGGARLELASVLADAGDAPGAEAELRELLRRAPGAGAAAAALGRLLAGERRYEEACEAYASACAALGALEPASAEARA
jgi:lipopolysaccharide biosynthesis regulator YciM